MDAPIPERKTKFQSLVEGYLKNIAESGFPPIAPINTPTGATNTASPTTSAVDQAVDTDPGVAAAKKKAADAIALQLKQKANTITHP